MLVNRDIRGLGGRTSIRLGSLFWEALREIAFRERKTLNDVIRDIERETVTLRDSSPDKTDAYRTRAESIRTYILDYFRKAATEGGHGAAGHGIVQLSPKGDRQ